MPNRFEWDRGNVQKSLLKHGITNQEAESVFEDTKRKIKADEKHSETEDRYICIGMSKFERILYLAFTFRKKKIRIISSRFANKKNRELYESET